MLHVPCRASLPPRLLATPVIGRGTVRRQGITGVLSKIQDGAAVTLEELPREDLGEDIRRVDLGRNMRDRHDAGAAHLAHLEELTIDVARVLSRGEAMAKVVSALVVGADVDGPVATIYPM